MGETDRKKGFINVNFEHARRKRKGDKDRDRQRPRHRKRDKRTDRQDWPNPFRLDRRIDFPLQKLLYLEKSHEKNKKNRVREQRRESE